MVQTVAVIGAASKEGVSVVTALLQDEGFKVRAVAEDLSSPLALQLRSSGAEVVGLDPHEPFMVEKALKGAHSCFCVTTTDFHHPDPLKSEIQWGYKVADLCKLHGIQHLVFMGQHHVHRKYALPARHMDAKASINDYMTEIGLPKTEVIVPFYFENFLSTFKPVAVGPDNYKLVIPMGDVPMDGISVAQIGPSVVSILKNRQHWIGKSCSLTADCLKVHEYAAILSRQLHPKHFRDSQASVRCFVETHGGAAAKDLGNMFEFWRKGNQWTNRALTAELCPDLQTFQEWALANKEQLKMALENP